MTTTLPDCHLRRVQFSDLPGWQDDDPRPLLDGMRACLQHVTGMKPYRSGSLGLTTDDLLPLLEAAASLAPDSAAAMRGFFESETVPFAVGRPDRKPGFVTGFYEPQVEVSDTPDNEWVFPFYSRPADLVDLGDHNRPPEMDAGYAFGRQTAEGIETYSDRGQIDRGALAGQGLELAWARSKVDVFFAHVQGAARLAYADGRIRRITYAAKAGHPFSPIGKLLIDRGEISRSAISMQAIRAWLAQHPEQVDEVLWHNRSFIFFREAEVSDFSLGPIAAAKVPLIAGRALAVDRKIHTFGFPFFIHSETLCHLDDGKPFARLMLALDTGSAILGPARGDIFTGSGFAAGEMAGTVRNDAAFYILIPKVAAGRYGG